jgi:hypothetical protein
MHIMELTRIARAHLYYPLHIDPWPLTANLIAVTSDHLFPELLERRDLVRDSRAARAMIPPRTIDPSCTERFVIAFR